MTQKTNDAVVNSLVASIVERQKRGFEKYGKTLERTDIDFSGWIQHLQEELIDAALYIERLKLEIGVAKGW